MNHLRLAIVKEDLGVGPNHYYILLFWDPNFEIKVLLLMKFLPEEKMSFHPWGTPLRGPFLHPRWELAANQLVNGIFQMGHFLLLTPTVMLGSATGRTTLPSVLGGILETIKISPPIKKAFL